MAKKDLQQLQTIKERMIAADIPEDEVNALVDPLKNELQRRVCGLVWEHTTTSIPDMKGKIPVLTPVTGKDIVNDINGDNHVLIEGENLLALMAMQYTHIDEDGKGMIDVIYIDPPYNTGSVSFAYNDKFEKSEWLSMMDIRLKLARNLLKDDGVIFVQIDDCYQAELKMLLNEVYGPDKFIDTIMVEMSNTGGMKVGAAKRGTITKNGEFIHIYGKTLLAKEVDRNALYDFVPGFDTHFALFRQPNGTIQKLGEALFDDASVKKEFEHFGVKPKTKAFSVKDFAKYFDQSHVFQSFALMNMERICRPRSEVPTVPDYIHPISGKWIEYRSDKRDEPYYLSVNDNNNIIQLVPMSFNYRKTDDFKPRFGRSVIRGDYWKGFWLDMGNLAKEGKVAFKNGKKPKRLISQLIKWANRPQGIVLDFFAGSGTTGHAVLDLNKEDGGHRQFILCTNNELGKEALKTAKKNGYPVGSSEYEDLGVCHAVTYPRMQNIFPDYPDNNLYYYRIDQDIAESSIDDVTIANMASRAVFYVAMKEKVFNAEQHGNYYLLYNNATDIVVATDPDMDMFDVEDEVVPTAFSRQYKKVYCSVYEPCMRNGIEYIPYPKEVLDVLKAAKKYIRREVA